jgi:hypothetical protein
VVRHAHDRLLDAGAADQLRLVLHLQHADLLAALALLDALEVPHAGPDLAREALVAVRAQ